MKILKKLYDLTSKIQNLKRVAQIDVNKRRNTIRKSIIIYKMRTFAIDVAGSSGKAHVSHTHKQHQQQRRNTWIKTEPTSCYTCYFLFVNTNIAHAIHTPLCCIILYIEYFVVRTDDWKFSLICFFILNWNHFQPHKNTISSIETVFSANF